MKKLLFALPVVLLLAAGCNSNQQTSQQNQPVNTQTQQTTPPVNAQGQQPTGSQQTTNWKTYSNTKYHFELSYPSSWTVTENDSYISIKPTAKNESNFSIATVNVGRETVFGLGAKVKIQDTTFAGQKAKIYDCKQQSSGCPTNISASVAIKLIDLPTDWGQWNEIDYEVYKYENVNVADFQQILDSLKFTVTTTDKTTSVYSNTKYGYEIELPKTWKAYSEYDGKVIANNPAQFPANPLILTGTPPDVDFQIEFQEGVVLVNVEKLLPQEKTSPTTVSLQNNHKGKKYVAGTNIFFLTETSQGTLKIYSNKNFANLDKIISSIVIK